MWTSDTLHPTWHSLESDVSTTDDLSDRDRELW